MNLGSEGPRDSTGIKDRQMQSSNSKFTEHRKRVPARLLSPSLIQALTKLAAAKGLPLATLIALLINEGLDHWGKR
jgi:predicted DNA binding CopG/RHH family protein